MRGKHRSLVYFSPPLCTRSIYSPFSEASQYYMTRRSMQRLLERFWSPFCANQTGPDLKRYGFLENLNEIRTPDKDFTCQVNGAVGDAKLLEDFFIVLLCGFDIENAHVENTSSTDTLGNLCDFKGSYTLKHTRPFLGWKPPAPNCNLLSGPGNESNAEGSAIRGTQDSCITKTSMPPLHVPFSARLEGANHLISHMSLRSPVLDIIMNCPGCPIGVRQCLQNVEALQALVSLRRANVSPNLINDKTLAGITLKKEMWASALGIL